MKNIFLLLLLISSVAYSQDTTFYKQMKKVVLLDSAEQFRVVQLETDTQLYIAKYYNYENKTARLESEDRYKDSQLSEREGNAIKYHKNGNIISESVYKNGKLNERQVTYYEDKKVLLEVSYTNGLKNGAFKMYYRNGQTRRNEIYASNKWMSGKMYDSTGVEIAYCGEYEILPEYPGGTAALYKFLRKNITFPRDAAQDKTFSGGNVFLTFMVEPDGSIKDTKLLRGLHPACDAEAIRVLSIMPAWQPGYQDCKVASFKFNLPVNFSK